MPGFIAKKLCPSLIILPINMSLYKEKSNEVMNILEQYGLIESMGLDEALIDITDYWQNNSSSYTNLIAFLDALRNTVQKNTGLTCSIGAGVNRMVAKMASEKNKPNGSFVCLTEKDIREFLQDLPTRYIFIIKEDYWRWLNDGTRIKSFIYIQGLGIDTIGQILQNIEKVKVCFSDMTYEFLLNSALGIGRNYSIE